MKTTKSTYVLTLDIWYTYIYMLMRIEFYLLIKKKHKMDKKTDTYSAMIWLDEIQLLSSFNAFKMMNNCQNTI